MGEKSAKRDRDRLLILMKGCFMRINHQGQYQTENSTRWHPLATIVPSTKSLSGKEERATSPSRQVSCFLNGLLTIVARLLMGQSVTLGCLLPNSLNPFSQLD